MENYAPQYPASYPDSGDSSPRSREIEFENPPPWDDQNYKVKLMCSYGGKIQPRTHDNNLSYVGGDTKILAVDRNIKFPSFLSKLEALISPPHHSNNSSISFKYQLPGEDLDALISVTNDDDLDHMMHEYDRLYRASARPSRMRLFLFLPENPIPSAPISPQPDPVKPNNVDFLFGIDKPVVPAAPPPPLQQTPLTAVNPVPEPLPPPPEYQPRQSPNSSDRVVGSDPGVNHHLEIQRQLQRLQIAESEQGPYRRRSDDNAAAGNYPAGDYYVQKGPEKVQPSNFPVSTPPLPQNQAGYWQEKAVSGEVYPSAGGGDQPVYMIPGPGAYYHAPMVRPPATQGYYAMQRLPSDVYREQPPVYGGVPPPKAPYSSAVPVTYPPAQAVKGPAYTEGVSVVRQAGIADNTAGAYAQVAYDSATGRHVYYTAQGGGVVHAPPYQGVAPPGSPDLRQGGLSLGQDVKVINKVSQGSV